MISRAESIAICVGAVLDVLQRRRDERGDICPEMSEAAVRHLRAAVAALEAGDYAAAERQHRIALAITVKASDATDPKIA